MTVHFWGCCTHVPEFLSVAQLLNVLFYLCCSYLNVLVLVDIFLFYLMVLYDSHSDCYMTCAIPCINAV